MLGFCKRSCAGGALVVSLVLGQRAAFAQSMAGHAPANESALCGPHFWLGPVEGFTTAPHEVALGEGLFLPLPQGTSVELEVRGLDSGDWIEWDGFDESGKKRRIPLHFPGPQVVRATVQPSGVRVECPVFVLPLRPEYLKFDYRVVAVHPFDMKNSWSQNPESWNETSVEIWKHWDSIAEVRELNGKLAISVNSLVKLDASPTDEALLDRNLDFSPLLEWRIDGEAAGTGTWLTKFSKGPHRIEVGPPPQTRRFSVTAYEVRLTETSIEKEGNDFAIRYTATTDPAGFEQAVNWVASTKFGETSRIFGTGSTFDVLFRDVFGADQLSLDHLAVSDGPASTTTEHAWLGVRADHAEESTDLISDSVSLECEAETSCCPANYFVGQVVITRTKRCKNESKDGFLFDTWVDGIINKNSASSAARVEVVIAGEEDCDDVTGQGDQAFATRFFGCMKSGNIGTVKVFGPTTLLCQRRFEAP